MTSSTDVRWLDGGLATTLQRDGLPPATPVDRWLVAHPDRIRAAHAAFVAAGSRVLLAGTFRLLPGVRPDWEPLALRAVDLASGLGAEVWAALGPGGGDAVVAARLRRIVDGVVLETRLDVGEAVSACAETRRALGDRPLAVTLTPRDDGTPWDGTPPEAALRRLLDAGADIVGFNCGSTVAGVVNAWSRCDRVDAPRWAKPGTTDPAEDAAAAMRHLAEDLGCAWVGGCCGVGPEAIAAAISAPGR